MVEIPFVKAVVLVQAQVVVVLVGILVLVVMVQEVVVLQPQEVVVVAAAVMAGMFNVWVVDIIPLVLVVVVVYAYLVKGLMAQRALRFQIRAAVGLLVVVEAVLLVKQGVMESEASGVLSPAREVHLAVVAVVVLTKDLYRVVEKVVAEQFVLFGRVVQEVFHQLKLVLNLKKQNEFIY
jgi:hypothetical protein